MKPDYIRVTPDNLLLEGVSDYQQSSNKDVNDKRKHTEALAGRG